MSDSMDDIFSKLNLTDEQKQAAMAKLNAQPLPSESLAAEAKNTYDNVQKYGGLGGLSAPVSETPGFFPGEPNRVAQFSMNPTALSDGMSNTMSSPSPMEDRPDDPNPPQDAPEHPLITAGKRFAAASKGRAPAADASLSAPQTNTISDSIKKLLEPDSELSDAQNQANKNRGMALLSRGVSQAIGGITRTKADTGTADTLEKDANSPVNDVMQKRSAATDKLKNAELQNKLQDELTKSDPKSDISQLYRDTMTKLGMPQGENISASSIEKAFPAISKVLEKQTNDANRAAMLSDKADTKKTADQDKAYTQMRKDLETFRGNRPVAQAAMDAYSADKAMALVKGINPDKLTTQDLRMLNTELAKIASGGVPGEHGVETLMPNNLRTKAAELQNFLTSNPSDAHAGEYVKKNLKYLQGMVDSANSSVDKYRSNISKGYKNRVNPDQFSEAQSDYHFGGDQQPSVKKIKVWNGTDKQPLLIDPSDLEHAKADGYKEVQ